MSIIMQDQAVRYAAEFIGAVPDDRIPGLWHVPGLPELTLGQMLQVASQKMAANAMPQ